MRRKYVACDFETIRFRPGMQAPPPVCLATYDGAEAKLYPTEGLEAPLKALLSDPDVCTVWHNAPYDLAVMHEWLDVSAEMFEALDGDRVVDTWVVERLGEIAGLTNRKGLDLGTVSRVHGIKPPDKEDAVRTDYGRLWNRPLSEYSEAHKRYALYDVESGLKVLQRQLKKYSEINHEDICFLVRRNFWLQMARNYGLRTDPNKIEQLETEVLSDLEQLEAFAKELGFVRENGTRDTKVIRAYIHDAYDGNPPMTKESRNRTSKKPFVPQVSMARSTLEESGDPILEEFARFGETAAVKNKDLPMLKRGAFQPIHTRYGMADSLRTTSSGPNVQNFRRKVGIRECVIPREGYCFLGADHGGLENACLAQVIWNKLGMRQMLDKLNAKQDLHSHIGAAIRGCSYDEFVHLIKDVHDEEAFRQRQLGKVVNFGRAGGMGAKTLKFFAKQSYQLNLTVDECKNLIEVWNRTHPDGMAYLNWIKDLPQDSIGRFSVQIPGTGVIRRGATFCAAANTHFQGLGAVLESHIGWLILKEIFRGPGPLKHCRLVNFIHDEFILECPIGNQTEAAKQLVQIMVDGAKKYLPDVYIDADPVAMACWSKDAKANKDWETKGLEIWQPSNA